MVLSPRSGRRQLILSCAAISLWRLSSSGLDCRVLWSQECSRFCFSLSHTHTCMHTLSFSLIHSLTHRPPPPPPPPPPPHTHQHTGTLSGWFWPPCTVGGVPPETRLPRRSKQCCGKLRSHDLPTTAFLGNSFGRSHFQILADAINHVCLRVLVRFVWTECLD